MSVEQHNFIYFDLDQVKDILHIDQNDDQEDDPLLENTFGPQAERWIINKLTPFADSLPLEGDDLETAMGAANKYAVSEYKAANNSLDMAKHWMTRAKQDLDALVTALKARHVNRGRIVAVSKDYDTEDNALFSQRQLFF